MNATNRAANRLLLLVVGLLLVAAGGSAALLALVPAFARDWTRQLQALRSGVPDWAGRPVLGSVGWLALGTAAVALVLLVVLIVFVVRQGRGHTGVVVERRAGERGRTRVDLDVPRTLLTEHLSTRPDILAARVTAYAVRGTPTLKVSVRARRGASPAAVATTVTGALEALDAVLGEQLPALVQISGGFRARTASRARVV